MEMMKTTCEEERKGQNILFPCARQPVEILSFFLAILFLFFSAFYSKGKRRWREFLFLYKPRSAHENFSTEWGQKHNGYFYAPKTPIWALLYVLWLLSCFNNIKMLDLHYFSALIVCNHCEKHRKREKRGYLLLYGNFPSVSLLLNAYVDKVEILFESLKELLQFLI